MKKLFLWGILFGISISSNAQNSTMYFGAEFAPVMSSHIPNSKSFIYKFALFFTHQKSEQWSYSAGIGFADFGKQNTITLDEFNVKITNDQLTLKAYRKGSFKYQYLYFPLNINFHIHNLKLLGGIHPYFFYQNEAPISNNYEFHTEILNPISKEQLNPLNFVLNLGVEYDIPFGNNWKILIKSTGDYFLIPFYKTENHLYLRPFSFGMTIGVKKQLSIGNKKIETNAK